MLLQLLLVLTLTSVSYAQTIGTAPNYPNYPDYSTNTNPPAYPNYGTNNEDTPKPHYPDYTYVETVETSTVSSTTAIASVPTVRRQNPRYPIRRPRTTGRPVNRIVRWYFINGQGFPFGTSLAGSYRTNALPYGLTPFYRTRTLGSRVMPPTRTQGQSTQTRTVQYWWYP